MKKAFVAMLAAGAIVAAAVTASAPAQAGNNTGAIVAAGVGGLALGTIIGANAAAYPAYQPVPGYVVYTGYTGRVPVACPGGHWGRKAVAFDRAGRPVAWSKPRWFCP
jgi:hypothetical protein